MEDNSAPTLTDVRDAADRLSGLVRATPLDRSPLLSDRHGGDVLLKLENQQITGSFKVRGALNAIASMGVEERGRGVVTASAGNHGAGVAHAASLRGVAATIFVPATAPATKRERIQRAGADLRLVDGGYDEAHRAAEAYARDTGANYVHAFSDPAVVAGQGTVGLEIIARVAPGGTLLVPVGGGGLIGGIGIVAKALSPGTRVVGVQTPATAAMHQSLAAGRLVAAPLVPSLCEGLAGDIDARSLRLGQEVIDEMLLVEEAATVRTLASLHRNEGVTAEMSGAVAAAAILAGLADHLPGPVVVVITGGNIDPAELQRLLEIVR